MKFCPRCRSTDVGWVLPYDRQKYECKDCGYVGALIVEDGKMAEDVRKEYIKKEQLKNKNKIEK